MVQRFSRVMRTAVVMGVASFSLIAAGSGRMTPADFNEQGGDAQHMDTGAKTMMTSPDASFAIKAAQGGLTEVKLGQLAAQKAADPDVKAFGQHMVDDHTKANEQLKAIAQEKGMTLPTDINAKQQATYNKLSKLSGAEFDTAYIKDMVSDHEEDVKDFSRESSRGKDEKIKGFATQTLPVLQGHLDKVKGLQGKTSSSSAH
jgi:putative membrane protein